MECLEYHITSKWKLIPSVSVHLWIRQKVKRRDRGRVSEKHKASAHCFPRSFWGRGLILVIIVVIFIVVVILLLIERAGCLTPRFGVV